MNLSPRHETHLDRSPHHLNGCAVVSLVIRSMRHLLQLLKLVRFHQLVLGLVTVRGALQLNVFKNVSVHEGSNDCQRTKSSVLGLNSPLLQSLLWRPVCYPASEGCSLFASGPESRSKELLYKKVKENEERPIRPVEI